MQSVESIENELSALTLDLVFETNEVFEDSIKSYLESKHFFNHGVKFSHSIMDAESISSADIMFQFYDGSEVIVIPVSVASESIFV